MDEVVEFLTALRTEQRLTGAKIPVPRVEAIAANLGLELHQIGELVAELQRQNAVLLHWGGGVEVLPEKPYEPSIVEILEPGTFSDGLRSFRRILFVPLRLYPLRPLPEDGVAFPSEYNRGSLTLHSSTNVLSGTISTHRIQIVFLTEEYRHFRAAEGFGGMLALRYPADEISLVSNVPALEWFGRTGIQTVSLEFDKTYSRPTTPLVGDLMTVKISAEEAELLSRGDFNRPLSKRQKAADRERALAELYDDAT